MAITSLTEVKSLNQISGSAYDQAINGLIPLVSDYIVTYCRVSDSFAESNPGLRLVAAQLIKFQLGKISNVTAESIGDYSVSYSNNYPDYLLDMLNVYRQPNFISDAYYENYNEALRFNQLGVGYKDTYNIK
jgi:hypothetical protein